MRTRAPAFGATTLRRLIAAIAIAGLATGGPSDAAAQGRTRRCTLVRGGTLNQFTSAGLGVIQQFGGPVVFRCGGGVLIRSRRATVLETRREVRLEGNVLYRDSVQELRTDWLQRRTADGFMLARGSVVLTDLASGSEIRGTQMRRRDVVGTPIETHILGRPHATLYGETSDGGPDGALGTPAQRGEPIEVDSDSIVLVGSNIFRALGNAEFSRGEDLSGSGQALEFDDATGQLIIDGEARIDGARYDLAGDRIDALTIEGSIREVSAFGHAVLEGDELYLEAPEVTLFFEGDLLQSLEARSRVPRVSAAPPPQEQAADSVSGEAAPGPAPGRDGAAARPTPPSGRADDAAPVRRGAEPGLVPGDGARARREPAAVAGQPLLGQAAEAAGGEEAGAEDVEQVFARAEGLEVRADSLHVLTPDERVQTLTAVGVAHGVRLADSLAASALPAEYADEWVRGDTVVAEFAPDSTAPADSVEQVLERLTAVGHGVPASALSHVAGAAAGDLTINYLIARRIVMLVRDGEAREVQAEGKLRGLYLTSEVGPAPAPADEDGAGAGATGPAQGSSGAARSGEGRAP
ncbi:MAG: hypothetical protein ABFS34_05260 [Gemmatimonadota bacterium]